MKLISSLLLAATLSLAAGTAMAACPDTAATGTDTSKTAGIPKDGTTAPMEGAEPSANTPAKDGSTMPLETDKDRATSQQDVEAQQDGEKTAAATAEDDKCK